MGAFVRLSRLFLLTLALTAFAACAHGQDASVARPDSGFEFALMGDAPYNGLGAMAMRAMLRDMDEQALAFIVHIGDIKGGGSECSDQLYRDRYRDFQASRHPLIYLFGDNEWTDCHRASAGGYDPLERLDKLRALFTEGGVSLGQHPIALKRQSDIPAYAKFRENIRWRHGRILFIGLNVPGSNNNLGRTSAMDAEYAERNAADLAWLREGFAQARHRNDLGVVVLIHGDPGFQHISARGQGFPGYRALLAALARESKALRRPVVLVHGDTHRYRVDQPLLDPSTRRSLSNFTRVETFGAPDVAWVRARVDYDNPRLFDFSPGDDADRPIAP